MVGGTKHPYEHCGKRLVRNSTWYIHDGQWGNYPASKWWPTSNGKPDEWYFDFTCGHLASVERQCYILCDDCAKLNGLVW